MSSEPIPGARDVRPPPVVHCQCPNGEPFLTTLPDCKSPCVVVSPAVPDSPLALFPYRLPSGTEVVGRLANYETDNGTFVYRIGAPGDLSTIAGTQLVICKLPSGLGVVTTYEDCVLDGGTVIGRILGRIP